MPTFDAHKNFAYSTVATAPSPGTSGTSLTVATGDGAKFPTPPFNATVWPSGAQPTSANAEIVRVTGIVGDTLTITRTQESTSARSILVGDQIAATITAKTLTDVETAASNTQQNVLNFGADPTGVADSTTAFTNAAAAGASIYAPAGTYLIAGTVEIAGKSLHGDGIGATVLKKANANVAMLTVTNGDKTQINDLRINNTVAATSGASLVITANDAADASTHTTALRNVRIDGAYTGIDISNSVCVLASDLWIFNYVNAATYVHDGTPLVEIHTAQFENLPLGSTAVGTGLLLANQAEGITLSNVEIIGGAYSIKTSAVTYSRGSCPAFCFFDQCFFDSAGVGGAASQGALMLDKTLGFKFTNCWVSALPTSTGSGAWLNNTEDTTFVNCLFAGSAQHGAHVSANAVDTRFVGCKFRGNSQALNATYNGLNIAAGASSVSIDNCTADGSTTVWTVTNKQNWGFNIAAGASDNYAIRDIRGINNVAGLLNDGGTGTNKIIDYPGAPGISPTDALWQTLFKPYGMRSVSGDGTLLLMPSLDGFGVESGGSHDNVIDFYHVVAANLAVTGRTVKLRLRVQVACNAVAPLCNFTFTMRSIAYGGSTSGQAVVTAGAIVTGGSVAITTPAASSVQEVATSAFSLPTDGFYTVCYQASVTPASGSHVTFVPFLEYQYV